MGRRPKRFADDALEPVKLDGAGEGEADEIFFAPLAKAQQDVAETPLDVGEEGALYGLVLASERLELAEVW